MNNLNFTSDDFRFCSLNKVVFSLFLTDFYQQLCVPLALLTSLPFFRHMSNFGAMSLSEKVNEAVPSLSLSCSGNAWMRTLLQMNIALS